MIMLFRLLKKRLSLSLTFVRRPTVVMLMLIKIIIVRLLLLRILWFRRVITSAILLVQRPRVILNSATSLPFKIRGNLFTVKVPLTFVQIPI